MNECLSSDITAVKRVGCSPREALNLTPSVYMLLLCVKTLLEPQ